MHSSRFLEQIPLWTIVVGTELLVLLAIVVGVYLSRVRKQPSTKDEEAPVGTVVGATLGLLAFILAFTFGMTASRFDTRKQVFLDEVNAIETTFLRAGLLPEPHRTEVRGLLKAYVAIRADLARHPANVLQAVKRSEEIQSQLWPHATALAETDLKNPEIVALFITSLNEMFDLQTERVTVGIYQRIPAVIWVALLAITILSMVQVGYLFGKAGKPNWFSIIALSLAFSAVVVLIADLDRSGAGARGMISMNQQPMLDLQERLNHQ
jgi:hypothetical protein